MWTTPLQHRPRVINGYPPRTPQAPPPPPRPKTWFPMHDRLSVTSHHETGASHAMHTGSSSFQLSLRSFLAQRRKVLNVSPHSPRRPFFLAWPLAKLNHPGTVKMQPLLFIRPLVRSTLPPSGSNAASCKPRRALAARTSPKQAIVSRVMVEEVRMDPGGLTSAISTLGRARRKGLRRQGNKFVP
jgi:hypothetical protein